MKIKIDSVKGIALTTQCNIISDYIKLNGINGIPNQTPKNTGRKIDSCGRRYHVSCKKAPTLWAFKIWWGV